MAAEQSDTLAVDTPRGREVARRRAIVILGMHRSGTSALTRLLSLCGGTLPQRLIGPNAANPTGYWEPPEIVEIHDEMLAAAGSSWDDPAEFSLTWLDSPAAQPFASRLRRSFAESFSGSSLTLLKDPRICQFVPLWTSILESMGIEPLFVLPVRNPLEVAASLKTRSEQDSSNELGVSGGMPEAKGLLLWLRSFLGAERYSRGRPRSFVSYEALMSDWHGVVVKVARDLAITWPISPDHIASQATDFLSPALRHHFSSAAKLEMRGDIAPWFKEAFRWAENATAGQMGPTGELDRLHDMLRLADVTYQPILTTSQASLNEATRSAAAQARHAQELAAALAKRESDLAAETSHNQKLTAALTERESALATQTGRAEELAAALRERDFSLAGLARSGEELTGALARLTATFEGQIAERDATLVARTRHGQELEAALADRDRALGKRARREEELKAELARHAGQEQMLIARDQALLALYGSTSWRVTAPLRWIGARQRRLRQILGRAYRMGKRILSTRSTAPLRLRRWARLVAKSGQLDPAWYLATYPDVGRAGLDPIEHYVAYGAAENRNPSPHFDTAAYLLENPDVARSGLNPLVHFVLHGQGEGRKRAAMVAAPAGAKDPLESPSIVAPSSAYETFDPSIAAAAEPTVEAIAFYLPQFHSIPENDAWWGTGFTEWRNVVRGQPRFAGHYQPRIPRDLGFYDLTHPDVMRRQIELAKAAGLRGFCYYFYWFDGRRLLEKPVDMLLADESLDFPFCIMWANENWTRRWDGFEAEVLISQSYAEQDEERLLAEFHRHFSDKRYIRVAGRPLLLIYRPNLVPKAAETFARWRERCLATYGYAPLVLGVLGFGLTDPREFGLDGALEFPPHFLAEGLAPITSEFDLLDPHFRGHVFDYEGVVARSLERTTPAYPLIRTVMPSWDNDARRQGRGSVYHGSTPQKYERWLREIVTYAARNPTWNRSFVFINAWNEWAEAAYLEPDIHYGAAYLNATARALSSSSGASAARQSMSVLLIGHDAYSHGAQRILLAIGEVMARRFGMTVEFVLLEGGPLLPSYQRLAPCSVLSKPLADSAMSTLLRLHDKGHRRAIANTTVSGKVVTEVKRAGMQLVTLVHELPGIIQDYGLLAEAKAIMQESDLVVFPAPLVRDKFRALTGDSAERCGIHPQGLYRTEIAADPTARARVRDELHLPAEAHIVLNVGYADQRKGFDLFVQAAEVLSTQRPDIYFVWIGAIAPDMAEWVADHEQCPNRHLLTPGPREEVRDYYNAADLFLLTSREDPFPSVVLEALAAGLPVVGFADTTGSETLIAKYGSLVPFGDLGAMAAAVEQQLSEAHANRESADARRREVVTGYDYADYSFWLLQCFDPALRRVSIIVPNYNHERHLPDRLSSIFEQNYPVFEMIVLDDASPDRSVEVIERTALAAGREIRLVVNSVNGGRLSDQWRKGLALCSGDYVWIAESDDDCDPCFLREAIETLERAGSGFCFCDSWQIDGEGRKIGNSYTPYVDDIEPGVLLRDFTMPGRVFLQKFLGVKNVILNMSGVLWRRSVLEAALTAAGADIDRLKLAADWRLYIQACLLDISVSYIARALNGHRRHERGITMSLDKDSHLAELRQMQALVDGVVKLGAQKKWLARKHVQQARQYLALPHDPADLSFAEFGLCDKHAQEMGVAPMIHEADVTLRSLLATPSLEGRERAIGRYFEAGRRSSGLLRGLLVSLGYDLSEPLSLLEFGADFGHLTRHWAQILPQAVVTACDPRHEAVDFISAHFGVDAAVSPFVPGRLAVGGEFAVVFAPSLFMRASPATWGDWLKALHGQVKPGGHLIFTTQGPSSAKLSNGVEIPPEGIWHRPGVEGNASTFVHYDYAAAQALARLGEELALYKPGIWSHHQDIYVVRRPAA
jgi:glycosyltransferase involved in cell wall biosynthesis